MRVDGGVMGRKRYAGRGANRWASDASTCAVSCCSSVGVICQDPESTPVGRDHEIIEMLLHSDAVHRGMRQVVLQRLQFSPSSNDT